jgi:hypothetical protein
VALVALGLQPFRDSLLLPTSTFLIQYETIDPVFVARMMPLMPPLPPVA